MQPEVQLTEELVTSILNNVAALAASRQLDTASFGLQRTIQRLTSGRRINAASDDAAGLAISNRLSADIRVAGQGRRNANDGISFLQVADGALNEVTNLLTRGAELAQQAQSGTLSAPDRQALNAEYQTLAANVNAILTQTKFNGAAVFQGGATSLSGAGSLAATNAAAVGGITNGFHNLHWVVDEMLGGSNGFTGYAGDANLTQLTSAAYDSEYYFFDSSSPTDLSAQAVSAAQAFLAAHPTDANAATLLSMAQYLQGNPPVAGNNAASRAGAVAAASGSVPVPGSSAVTVAVGGYSAITLNTNSSAIPTSYGALATAGSALTAQATLGTALDAVSSLRATLGASQQQLSSISNALGIQVENFTTAFSQIRDATIADEVVNLSRFQILSQSGTAALAQANLASQSIVTLLRSA
jgi:flagellin